MPRGHGLKHRVALPEEGQSDSSVVLDIDISSIVTALSL
jgi:hypothetical protein